MIKIKSSSNIRLALFVIKTSSFILKQRTKFFDIRFSFLFLEIILSQNTKSHNRKSPKIANSFEDTKLL